MPLDLFSTFEDQVRLRVEQVEHNVECPWPLSSQERMLLGLLKAHVGRENIVPLGYVCERLKTSPREVKDLVQSLRLNFRIQVGASRDSSGGGYYLGRTEAEMVESTTQMLHQAVTMLRVVAVMRGKQTWTELLGQMPLDLEKGTQDGR